MTLLLHSKKNNSKNNNKKNPPPESLFSPCQPITSSETKKVFRSKTTKNLKFDTKDRVLYFVKMVYIPPPFMCDCVNFFLPDYQRFSVRYLIILSQCQKGDSFPRSLVVIDSIEYNCKILLVTSSTPGVGLL